MSQQKVDLHRILLITAMVSLLAVATGAMTTTSLAQDVTATAEDVGISQEGETVNSTVSFSANDSVGTGLVNVSLQTAPYAEIVGAENATPPGQASITFDDGTKANPDLSDDEATFVYDDAQANFQNVTLGTVEIEWNESNPPAERDVLDINVDPGQFQTGTGNSLSSAGVSGEVAFGSKFLVSNLSPTDVGVQKGDTVNYTVDVKNDAQANGTQTIEFDVDEIAPETKNVSLTGGESKSVPFSVDTNETGLGVFGLTVQSEDDSVSLPPNSLRVSDNSTPANVSSSDVTLDVGERGNSSIRLDAPEGLFGADVNISVNTSAAKITGAKPGEDVNSSSDPTVFSIDENEGSVSFSYTNISGPSSPEDFELGVVEFELLEANANEPISVETDSLLMIKSFNPTIPYVPVNTDEGRISDAVFTEKLNIAGAKNPPKNVLKSQGGFDDKLVEDLDGDGDPTNTGPTVTVFGKLLRNEDLQSSGLTQDQQRALDWNPFSPEAEVQARDMVTLFGKQLRAD